MLFLHIISFGLQQQWQKRKEKIRRYCKYSLQVLIINRLKILFSFRMISFTRFYNSFLMTIMKYIHYTIRMNEKICTIILKSFYMTFQNHNNHSFLNSIIWLHIFDEHEDYVTKWFTYKLLFMPLMHFIHVLVMDQWLVKWKSFVIRRKCIKK